jgi:hypothetical protein
MPSAAAATAGRDKYRSQKTQKKTRGKNEVMVFKTPSLTFFGIPFE